MSVNQKQPVQLVFSTIDQEVIPHGQVDSLWQPQFDFDGKRKFLSPLAAPQPTSRKGITALPMLDSGERRTIVLMGKIVAF